MKNTTSFPKVMIIAITLMSLTACSGMNDSEQRVVSGGAIGATVGAVGTVITGGCVACGAALGGAVGAGAGYVIDQMDKSKN